MPIGLQSNYMLQDVQFGGQPVGEREMQVTLVGFFLNAFCELRQWGLLIRVYSLEYHVNTVIVV